MGKMERKAEKNERETSKKEAASKKASKDAEDAYWKSHGEGDVSKAAQKKAEEERKRAEAAARKAENKMLADAEEAQLTAPKAKGLAPAGSQKITKHQLDTQRELEAKMKEAELEERRMAAKREVSHDAYSKHLESHANTNRAEDLVDARSVEAALSALGVGETAAEDKHPEKRMKAAWKAYEERMLPQLKQEKPGLRLPQYKDLLWKMWQKAPENPMNQAKSA